MRRLFTSLPLTLVLIGCGTPATQDVTANTTTDASSTTNTTTASADTSSSESASANVEKTAADTGAAQEGTTKGAYQVSESKLPELPPQFVAELAKVKLTPADLTAAMKKNNLAPPPTNTKVPDKVRVRMQTSKGPITVELNGQAAPLHVRSFLYLSQKGFYNGTHFHRYEPGFVIQGGDPLSKGPIYTKLISNENTAQLLGMSGPGYQVPRENNQLKHEQFVLAAARSQDPNSAGSQFYFTLEAAPHLDEGEGYTVYGKVVEGQNTIRKLGKGDEVRTITVVK